MSGADETPKVDYPPGEYAIVELMGHSVLIGRYAEVEAFGTKMLAIEPLFNDTLLPAVLQAGGAISRLTPCSAAVAFSRQPRQIYQLPGPVRAVVPAALLPAPGPVDGEFDEAEPAAEDDAGWTLPNG